MPKRPRQHILEDESRKRFEQLLPDHWVIRKPDPDYGIDAEVEMFNENSSSTGLVFNVQLKATDEEDLSKALKLSFKKDTIDYYHTLKLPVLIARYHSPTKSLFSRWAHSIDLYYSSPDAKYYTVQFTEDSRWGTETPRLIRTYLEQLRDLDESLPLPIEFSLRLDAQFSDNAYPLRLESKIRSLIKAQQLPIRLTTEDRTDLRAKITVASKKIGVSIFEKKSFVMHGLQGKDDNYNENCLPFDILSIVGCSFFITGRKAIALQILADNLPHSALIKSINFLSIMSSFIGPEKAFGTVVRLLKNVLKSDRSDKVGIVNNVYMMIFVPGFLKFGCPKDLQKEMASILLDLAITMESEGDNKAASMTYYNLGNAMRSSSFFTDRQVFSWYIKAARGWEAYLKRDYFWVELGGVLFHCGKYLYSSNFYKRALTIKEKPCNIGLCADALMFAGRYDESLAYFRDYHRKEKNLNPEISLKAEMVKCFIKFTGIKRQRRMIEKAFNLADIDLKGAMSSKKTATAAISELEEIYKVDLLCPMMWAHLATLYNYVGEIEQAFHASLTTGLLDQDNPQAWWACIMLGSQIRSPILETVCFLAYQKNDEALFESFMQGIEERGKSMDGESAKMFKSIFDKIRSHYKDHALKDHSILRFFNGEDSYEEIKVNDTLKSE
jgi:tetratricopeptide (TPR) repeat protein